MRTSVTNRHVASAFVDAVRGTLAPPKGVDAPSFVRLLANGLGKYSSEALTRAATAMHEKRKVYLPSMADLLPVAEEAAKALASEAAGLAAEAAAPAGYPELAAKWPEVRLALCRQLGEPMTQAWFGPGTRLLRVASGRVVLCTRTRFSADRIRGDFADALLAACRHALGTGIESVEITHGAAA